MLQKGFELFPSNFSLNTNLPPSAFPGVANVHAVVFGVVLLIFALFTFPPFFSPSSLVLRNGQLANLDIMGWFAELTGYVAPFFLIMSPIISYSDQIISMHRNKSSAGFSLDIPLIMLVASFLRSVQSSPILPLPTLADGMRTIQDILLAVQTIRLVFTGTVDTHGHHASYSTQGRPRPSSLIVD